MFITHRQTLSMAHVVSDSTARPHTTRDEEI